MGYCINENYDISLHAEFLYSNFRNNDKNLLSYSGLNLGFTLGDSTASFAQTWLLYSEFSIYKSLNFDAESYVNRNLSKPSLLSGQASSAIYIRIPISASVLLLPNAGGLLGYGNYSPSYSSAHFRQGFDSFQTGLQLGLDLLIKFSQDF